MERIKVAVSPFFGGEDWTDELTNITFEKNPRGLNVYSIPSDLDLTNIRKAIRLNSLILVEGNVGDFNEVEEINIEAPKLEDLVDVELGKPDLIIGLDEELPADAILEVEEVKEAPKKKTTKKKSK